MLVSFAPIGFYPLGSHPAEGHEVAAIPEERFENLLPELTVAEAWDDGEVHTYVGNGAADRVAADFFLQFLERGDVERVRIEWAAPWARGCLGVHVCNVRKKVKLCQGGVGFLFPADLRGGASVGRHLNLEHLDFQNSPGNGVVI